jgi:hypothetical protein
MLMCPLLPAGHPGTGRIAVMTLLLLMLLPLMEYQGGSKEFLQD